MAYKNPEDRKKYARQHYLNNKEKYLKKSVDFRRQIRKDNRLFLNRYLSNHPCVDCGEMDILVLEFDHVRGKKEFNVSDCLRHGINLKRTLLEIDKCEVRCANCHRKKTYHRMKNKLIKERV